MSCFVSTSSLVKAKNGFMKWTSYSVELFHIVFDVLGVGGDHRAVVVVAGLRSFVALVGDTRIEDNRVHPDVMSQEI